MEQNTNQPSKVATDEPASSFTLNTLVPAPAEDFSVLETMAVEAPDGRTTRHDGWTQERIRIFLTVLSQCGVVSDAARAAGISVKSAYRLRNRSDGRAFHLAWNAAIHLARRRLADVAMSRAVNGWVETVRRDGKVWAERNRVDNRLTMAVLTRLDRKANGFGAEDWTARAVAQEFDQFVDMVSNGDGQAAAEFVVTRRQIEGYDESFEVALLDRAEYYRRFGVGLPQEIDTSDLDPDEVANWTEDQAERAEASGVEEELTAEQRATFEAIRHRSWEGS